MYYEASDIGKNATRVGRRRKFGKVSCTEYADHGNDFKFIPTVKIETKHPVQVEGLIDSVFSVIICNHCGVMAAEVARR